MKIFVFIKRVPDTESSIRIASDEKSVITEGLHHITSPYDDYAIEEAVRIKEKHGGDVTVVSLGDEKAVEVIRRALAMGVDEGILLKTERNIIDPYVIANALAEFTRKHSPDIILFGKQAVDNDNAHVGLIFADLLDLPCINLITDLQIDGNKAIAKKESDDGMEIVEVQLPAVFTAQKGLNEPRLPALIKIMKARKKAIPIEEPILIDEKIEIVHLDYPPKRAAGKIVGQGAEAVSELVRLLKDEAQVF